VSRDLLPRYQFGARVSPNRIDEDDINDRALQEGEEITVWSTQVPADKAYVWGYGQDNRDAGDANYVFAEFLEDGTGTGTDGNVIRDAEVVVAVTDSTEEDTLAKTTLGPDAGDLADSKADNRTERPIFPEHAPGATEDKYLQLRLRARSGADGVVVGNDSDVHIGYGTVG
jgi:hypothetical protein